MSSNAQNQTPAETPSSGPYGPHLSKHTEPGGKSESDWSTGFYHGKNRGRNPRKSLHQLHHTQTLRGAETSGISFRAVKREVTTDVQRNHWPIQASRPDPALNDDTEHLQSSQTTVRTSESRAERSRVIYIHYWK